MLCDTKTTADVFDIRLTVLRHLMAKPMSPTASTSSRNKMSGSIRIAATAKPRRTFMPEL